MAGNFDFLLSQSDYGDFAQAAVDAERSMLISTINCAAATRRALELAVKWVYKVDRNLSLPYRDNLSSLTRHGDFLNIIDEDLEPLIVYIIKLGNLATHTGKSIDKTKAMVALRNLFAFIQWIDYCYGYDYEERGFDESLVPSPHDLATTLSGKEAEAVKAAAQVEDVPLEEQRNATDEGRGFKGSHDPSAGVFGSPRVFCGSTFRSYHPQGAYRRRFGSRRLGDREKCRGGSGSFRHAQ
ncbi:hypothetical protein PEPNEM18_01300 [Aedoeadaptatus nemausensis]|uniref:Uncharacterized protein n=1 Tax=Aedoeadaptatus nemausensis TaxID=2582829 RepID=A0A6V6Y5V3_9FIRM|nr:DUF4145 domain-containing protein [Peptoniphilus nemausensis]CAC9933841.1 hypothetical protein PEPNEM18_01300 [Peptoniphilus nemausensis]